MQFDPTLALWTVVLFLFIQQVEGNVIQPMVQQRAADLPPAVMLFSMVAGGLIFGMIGIFVAAPITVVFLVFLKRLYVREALNTPTKLPADPPKENESA